MTRRWAGTQRRLRILSYLNGYINWRGYPPSYREIAKLCKIASISTVHYHLKVLEKHEYIRMGIKRQARSITITDKGSRYLLINPLG